MFRGGSGTSRYAPTSDIVSGGVSSTSRDSEYHKSVLEWRVNLFWIGAYVAVFYIADLGRNIFFYALTIYRNNLSCGDVCDSHTYAYEALYDLFVIIVSGLFMLIYYPSLGMSRSSSGHHLIHTQISSPMVR